MAYTIPAATINYCIFLIISTNYSIVSKEISEETHSTIAALAECSSLDLVDWTAIEVTSIPHPDEAIISK